MQINLSPDKAAVLRECYRVLAPGGEVYFSDVYCDRRIPKEVRARVCVCCSGVPECVEWCVRCASCPCVAACVWGGVMEWGGCLCKCVGVCGWGGQEHACTLCYS